MNRKDYVVILTDLNWSHIIILTRTFSIAGSKFIHRKKYTLWQKYTLWITPSCALFSFSFYSIILDIMKKSFSLINNNKIIIRSTHGRGADLPLFLHFGHGPILVQINLQHSQAQPYGICTRVIYLTQTHYMCSVTLRCS